MGKSNGTIVERLNLCGTCRRPIVSDNFFSVKTYNNAKSMNFHNTAQDCANAEPLRRDWYRQHDRTSAHHRTKAGLQAGDGYTRDTHDDMSVWLGDLEFKSRI